MDFVSVDLPIHWNLFLTPKSIFAVLLSSFSNMHRVAKTLSHLTCSCTFPAEAEQDDALTSCFSSQTVNKCPFHGLFSAMFFIFSCFLLVIFCLKWPQSIVLQCCLVFLSKRRLCCALPGKCICISSIQSLVISVVGCLSSVLMNQQYILNKRSLKNTRLYIGQFDSG